MHMPISSTMNSKSANSPTAKLFNGLPIFLFGNSNTWQVITNVPWVNNNNLLASMSIDDGFETQPPAFNLMEHDHIDHFMVANNVEGVPIEPPHTIARFSRFLGMLSQKASYFPINIGTLDWPDAITLELEPKIQRVCEKKLNDRWKNYKANLKKAYYTPCLHSPLADGLQLWDTVDAQEQVNGSKPDCITFFTLTHTRKNGEPVDSRPAAIISAYTLTINLGKYLQDDFNTKIKQYEDRNEIITDEVHHIVYADVLGLERNNHVEAIRASYEEQRKAANIEIEKLRWRQSENRLAQLRKEHTDSMMAHNRRVELEVKNMKREMRAGIMSALTMTANGGMVEPNGVNVTQVCVNRIEQMTSLEIQASGEVEDEGFIRYRPCMVNVTVISK
ncbi:hypothetical protein D8674_021894 [Pyrus ussuriensis x Pyrus communis]|uniref:Uncharacterized protein n=1 Tax=Pyrus ussuriensis x Pyrus communis TaxID=2448454 RepID=A0A5N5GIE0_9ROSA|nr:hypothetical protein D8674_021894 [Pyrus ussuriensis x Pyrus communis]